MSHSIFSYCSLDKLTNHFPTGKSPPPVQWRRQVGPGGTFPQIFAVPPLPGFPPNEIWKNTLKKRKNYLVLFHFIGPFPVMPVVWDSFFTNFLHTLRANRWCRVAYLKYTNTCAPPPPQNFFFKMLFPHFKIPGDATAWDI